jgi:hypothetical protein
MVILPHLLELSLFGYAAHRLEREGVAHLDVAGQQGGGLNLLLVGRLCCHS